MMDGVGLLGRLFLSIRGKKYQGKRGSPPLDFVRWNGLLREGVKFRGGMAETAPDDPSERDSAGTTAAAIDGGRKPSSPRLVTYW
jgi:hypothetical protein